MQQYHICTRTLQWSHKKPESSTVVVITDSKMSQTFTKEMDASLSLLWFPVPFPALSQPKLWWGPSLPSPTKCRPVWNSSLCSPAPIQQLRKPSWGVFILSSIEEYFWGGVKETMFETTMKSCQAWMGGGKPPRLTLSCGGIESVPTTPCGCVGFNGIYPLLGIGLLGVSCLN